MRRISAALLVLGGLAFAPPPPALAASWAWPVRGELITPYRNGSDPYASGQHRGIDIGAPVGTEVLAAVGGTVTWTGIAGSSGVTVSIRTGDDRFHVSYLHLSSASVAAGDQVVAGRRLGSIGTSGRRSDPRPHLHFGVREAVGEHAYVDPLTLLGAPPASDVPRGAPPVPAPARPGPVPAPRPVPSPRAAPAPSSRPTPAPRSRPAARPSLQPRPSPRPRTGLRPQPGLRPRGAPARRPRPLPAPRPHPLPVDSPPAAARPGLAPSPALAQMPHAYSSQAPTKAGAPSGGADRAGAPRRSPGIAPAQGPAPTAASPDRAATPAPPRTASSPRQGPDLGLLLAFIALGLAGVVLAAAPRRRNVLALARATAAALRRPLFGHR